MAFDVTLAGRPSPREHITSGLTGRTSDGRAVSQYETVGMEDYPALDTADVVVLLLEELRAYGLGSVMQSEERLDQFDADLAELNDRLYERAARYAVPLSPQVLRRSIRRILNDPVVRVSRRSWNWRWRDRAAGRRSPAAVGPGCSRCGAAGG
ncbi:hypothetical protein NKH77_28775 [Streptomyces sp. M19]